MSAVYFRSSLTGWAVGGYGTSVIIRTTNGGTNWTSQSSGSTEPLFDVFFNLSCSTGWIVGGNGTILKTTNNGLNWISQFSGINNAALYSVYFTSLTTGWTVAQFGIIAKTTNGGTNWILQSSGTSSWLNSVYFTSSTTGWAVGGYTDQSIILKTTTGGIDPFNLNLSTLIEGFYDGNSGLMNGDSINVYLRNSASPYSIVDSAKKYLGSSGHSTLSFINAANATPYYIVIKHRNSIETWSGSAVSFSSNSLTYDFTTAASMAYGNNLILKGTRYCLYSGDVNQDGVIDGNDASLADNDAANFASGYLNTDVNGDNTVDGSDLSIIGNNSFNYISVRRPTTLDGPNYQFGKSDKSGKSSKQEKFELKDNYPNPFNPTTKINYELPVSNYVSLKVFDITGKEVASLVSERQNAGRYSVEFDAGNLSSGTYFYKISATGGSGSPREAGEFVQMKKMILVK